MQINYFIGGIEVEPPINQAEFGIELNFDKDDNSNQAVSLTEFEFGVGDSTLPNDAARLINLHRSNGLSSGVGIFEGLPFQIELTQNGTTEVLFDGYLNTSTALWDCDIVTVSAVEKGKIDFLNETADSITFAYLYDPNNERDLKPLSRITNADFISVPYVLNSVPDNKEALLAVISLAFMIDTIQRELQALIEASVSVANPLDFLAAVKLILRATYIVGLIVLLVALIERIFNLLIQPIKYHECMYIKTLCDKGAAHFGLTFESPEVLDTEEGSRLIILPKKYSNKVNTITNATGNDDILGNLNANASDSKGYYQGTFGQLLRDLKEAFNAKIVINGDKLLLVKEDYNNSAYNYQLPPVDQTQYTLNAQDLKSNYTVEFLTDINDKNTLQNYDGTITQAITRPDRTINTDMVLMTGLETRLIPFARATRKNSLTNPERIIQSIAPVFDPIASTISSIADLSLDVADFILNNKIASAAALLSTVGAFNYAIIGVIIGEATFTISDILTWFNSNIYDTGVNTQIIPRLNYTSITDKYAANNRIGMLLMENDIVDIPKVMLIDEDTNNPINTNINSNNENIINSEFLYNNFHFLRNFAITGSRPHGNQYKIYSASGVPFCWDDYQLLKNSNRLQDSDGREGELISCRWNIEQANSFYRIQNKRSLHNEHRSRNNYT
jgi:hypothetical protein